MEYNRDAYVDELPFAMEGRTHAVIVDIVDGNEIRHQIISTTFGENNAKGDAANLNLWRDQTKFKQ